MASVLIVMMPAQAGVVAAFAAGALGIIGIGMVNGLLVSKFGVPPVIVTLGMLMMASGTAAWLAGGMPIALTSG